jgi:predicted AlkP superfamily pyrophosphatase or phosphodiesterase
MIQPTLTTDCSAFPGTTFAALTSIVTGVTVNAIGLCLGPVT